MRPALFILVLALPAWAGDALTARAEWTEDRGALRLSVETGGLPPRACLTVGVYREVATLAPRESVLLEEIDLPLDALKGGEGRVRLGGGTVPGRYRASLSMDETRQLPEVRSALGRMPGPAEILLPSDLSAPAYLEALKKDEAWLEEAFRTVEAFVGRMNELETLCAQDREKGVEAWTAWHPAASKGLQDLIGKGRAVGTRFYPETCQSFIDHLVSQGLIVMELRKLQKAPTGLSWEPTGTLRNRDTLKPADLEPFRTLFQREILWYRLQVLKAVVAEAQSGREGRKRWDAVLALIGPEDPAAPTAKRLADWLEDPTEERKLALQEAYATLEAAFQAK